MELIQAAALWAAQVSMSFDEIAAAGQSHAKWDRAIILAQKLKELEHGE